MTFTARIRRQTVMPIDEVIVGCSPTKWQWDEQFDTRPLDDVASDYSKDSQEDDGYRLPVEVLAIVAEYLVLDSSHRTCANLNETCHAVRRETTATLWRTISSWNPPRYADTDSAEDDMLMDEIHDRWEELIYAEGAKYTEFLLIPPFALDKTHKEMWLSDEYPFYVNANTIFPRLKAFVYFEEFRSGPRLVLAQPHLHICAGYMPCTYDIEGVLRLLAMAPQVKGSSMIRPPWTIRVPESATSARLHPRRYVIETADQDEISETLEVDAAEYESDGLTDTREQAVDADMMGDDSIEGLTQRLAQYIAIEDQVLEHDPEEDVNDRFNRILQQYLADQASQQDLSAADLSEKLEDKSDALQEGVDRVLAEDLEDGETARFTRFLNEDMRKRKLDDEGDEELSEEEIEGLADPLDERLVAETAEEVLANETLDEESRTEATNQETAGETVDPGFAEEDVDGLAETAEDQGRAEETLDEHLDDDTLDEEPDTETPNQLLADESLDQGLEAETFEQELSEEALDQDLDPETMEQDPDADALEGKWEDCIDDFNNQYAPLEINDFSKGVRDRLSETFQYPLTIVEYSPEWLCRHPDRLASTFIDTLRLAMSLPQNKLAMRLSIRNLMMHEVMACIESYPPLLMMHPEYSALKLEFQICDSVSGDETLFEECVQQVFHDISDGLFAISCRGAPLEKMGTFDITHEVDGQIEHKWYMRVLPEERSIGWGTSPKAPFDYLEEFPGEDVDAFGHLQDMYALEL